MDKYLLGVDAGGTFTDFVLWQPADSTRPLRLHKVLSTPEAPEQAILQGIEELGLRDHAERGRLHIIHGSTVATNAVLEGKLAATAFITNRGFRDLLTLGRQTRPSLFSLEFAPRQPPVPEPLCLETGGRVAATGETLEPLTVADLDGLVAQLRRLKPEAVAINLLFSFVDDSHERRIEAAIAEADLSSFVCRSSAVLAQYREYERGIATWLNAALGPVIKGYLQQLEIALPRSRLRIMQSSGETLTAPAAAGQAVHLLLSGPAGGLAAMAHVADLIGEPRVMSFDMGGTSTDVALLEGAPQITSEGRVAGYPVGVPMVDMHTIGAGGGSIAYLDAGGMLQVGPQSAGARPGPACYGRGGTMATVTDANLVLGRLPAHQTMAGGLKLDLAAARRAISPLAASLGLDCEATAEGIVRIANEHMAGALRLISVQRGHDPGDFILACFGGAGGLHVCALARAMGMQRALVPVNPGVLSAMGMLVAPPGRQVSRTLRTLLEPENEDAIRVQFDMLREAALLELGREGFAPDVLEVSLSADLRYQGQSYWLNVPWTDRVQAEADFHDLHQLRYGFTLPNWVELVNIRVRLIAQHAVLDLPEQPVRCAPKEVNSVRVFSESSPVPVFDRADLGQGFTLDGPAVIIEVSATTFVESGWRVTVDRLANLLLQSIP